jgi:hypothetical protein
MVYGNTAHYERQAKPHTAAKTLRKTQKKLSKTPYRMVVLFFEKYKILYILRNK